MMKSKAVLSFLLCIALFAGMLVLPAGAAEISVTITFDTGGGTPVDPITQDEGTAVAAPADPVKPGYIFTGWDPAVPAIMPAGDVVCVAQWDIRPDPSVCNTIHLDPGGGRWYPDPYGIDPIIPIYEGGIPYPPILIREGYIFIGWEPPIPAYCPVDDITCVAQWEAIPSTITFDTDGGSAVAPITQVEGTAVTPPADPVKAGFNFMGWIPAVPAIMPADDVTCVAQWDVIPNPTFTIIFDPNGGSGFDFITQEVGTPVNMPPDPTRAGYIFAGWSPTPPAIMPEFDLTCIAQWQPIIQEPVITLDPNGGKWHDGSTSPRMFYYVDGILVPSGWVEGTPVIPQDVTRDGYVFMGWTPCIPATMPADNMTCYAQWELITYTSTITFDSDGGSAVAPITQDEGTPVTGPADPVKAGFNFVGWMPAVPATMPEDDVTCYAQWEPIIHACTRIYWDFNGGRPGGGYYPDAVCNVEDLYGVPDPVRDGYSFAGWSPGVLATLPEGDLTIVAQWRANPRNITFDTVGGSAVAPISQEEGTPVLTPADPTRAGYIFTGWSPAVPAIMPADDITCVAQWRLFGDLDNNGSITSIDALMALQGSTGEYTLSALQLLAADVNHDGRISPLDALMLLQAASGSITL